MPANLVTVAGDEKIRFYRGLYDNGRLAVFAICEDGEPWGKLSINEPGIGLADGEFIAKTWAENSLWVEDARKCGLFMDTGSRVQVGHCRGEVWRIAEGVTIPER